MMMIVFPAKVDGSKVEHEFHFSRCCFLFDLDKLK
jgi:hypothetical protein